MLRKTRAIVLALAVLGVAAAASGCGSAPGPPLGFPDATVIAKHAGAASRLVVIVMENESLSDVIGNASALYINSLARRYASASDYHGVSHPSLPNYLALTGGATFGISSDCTDCTVRASNIIDQLAAAGIGWKAYMEDMPRPCYLAAAQRGYAKKHDPFVYYADVFGNPGRCAHVVPLSQLPGDLGGPGLSSYSWITPNLCDDMHDCSVATGDRFLKRLVPPLLAGLGPHGLLALVWDEGTSSSSCCGGASGGRVPLVLAGPDVRRGVYGGPADHYSLLRLFEDALGVPRLRGAACPCTPSLEPMLISLPRVRPR